MIRGLETMNRRKARIRVPFGLLCRVL